MVYTLEGVGGHASVTLQPKQERGGRYSCTYVYIIMYVSATCIKYTELADVFTCTSTVDTHPGTYMHPSHFKTCLNRCIHVH